MIKVADISELEETSNRFQQSIDAINNLASLEQSLGLYMQRKKANELFQLTEMNRLLILDEKIVPALIEMRNQYISWRNLIDTKIKDLKIQEFPNEIVL